MAAYNWYATPVNAAGTSTGTSTLVTVYVGTTNPGGYDIFIYDADGDGQVGFLEWKNYTGGGAGLNGASQTLLFDGSPGGAGTIYSATPITLGTTGLKNGLTNNFSIDPRLLGNTSTPCFRSGTHIATPRGEVKVEELVAGDLVSLADGGAASILWTGSVTLSCETLLQKPKLRPIFIPAGAFETGPVKRGLFLSPHHRILLRANPANHPGNASEVLISARHFVGFGGVQRRGAGKPVSYHHILLAEHSLILSEGLPTESLYLGPEAWQMLPPASRAEIENLFPQWRHSRPPSARPIVMGKSADMLVRSYFEGSPPRRAGKDRSEIAV